MNNSADLGGCYPPRSSASVDNTLLDLQNSSYPTQPHSIIAKYPRNFLSNRANQRESDSNNFNSFSESLHKRSRAVNRFVKNGKANFGSPIEGNPKYFGQKKPK